MKYAFYYTLIAIVWSCNPQNTRQQLSNNDISNHTYVFESISDSVHYTLIFLPLDTISDIVNQAQFSLVEKRTDDGSNSTIQRTVHCFISDDLLYTDSLGNSYFPLSCHDNTGEIYYGLDFIESENDLISVNYIEMDKSRAEITRQLQLSRKE